MRRFCPVVAAVLIALSASGPLSAQEPLTRQLEEGQQPGEAKLADLAWLAGVWSGEGIGGHPAYETYSPPAGGQIVGHFTQTGADGPQFHELITLVQRGDSIALRLKHFNADLEGWETADAAAVVEFPFVAREGESWYFAGLTMRREGPDAMTAAVRVSDEGDELVFHYQRVH